MCSSTHTTKAGTSGLAPISAAFTMNQNKLSCRSCHYSTGIATEEGVRLWCWLLERMADGPCHRYVYEPGTDDTDEIEVNKLTERTDE